MAWDREPKQIQLGKNLNFLFSVQAESWHICTLVLTKYTHQKLRSLAPGDVAKKHFESHGSVRGITHPISVNTCIRHQQRTPQPQPTGYKGINIQFFEKKL